MKYSDLNDFEKETFVRQKYLEEGLSLHATAKIGQTTANRIRRDLLRFGYQTRNRSEAGKKALETGALSHPTKGKGHSAETKQKISEANFKTWDESTVEEKQARKQRAKDVWDKKNNADKLKFIQQGNEAIRQASVEGSKLEKFLHKNLIAEGYQVQFHREKILTNEKLQFDLFLPALNTVIEIDGISHFEDIWGKKTYERNIKADNKKSALILSLGLVLIRVKCPQHLSQKAQRTILDDTIKVLQKVETKFPPRKERYIEI